MLPSVISEKIMPCKDIFDTKIKLLEERLHQAATPLQMSALADEWLKQYLMEGYSNDRGKITVSSNLIVGSGGLVNIDDLAHCVCMSVRNFERNFILGTGMAHKQLCCVMRFNTALNLKLISPKSTRTIIAHEAGYFDQMHLIKDFKRFAVKRHPPYSGIRHY